MNRSDRLHLISKSCYYLAWAGTLAAVLGHLTKFDQTLFNVIGISGRNILEASVLLFIACVASEIRAIGIAPSEKTPLVKGQAA